MLASACRSQRRHQHGGPILEIDGFNHETAGLSPEPSLLVSVGRLACWAICGTLRLVAGLDSEKHARDDELSEQTPEKLCSKPHK